VRARALGGDRAELVNTGDAPARVTVTHGSQTAERVLAAGETAVARLDDGRLITAGPEYEPLRDASARIAALLDAIAAWEADGTLSDGNAARLTAATERVARELDGALEAALAVSPDTARAAAATEAARRHLDRIDARRTPPEVAERIEADRAAVGPLLDRALREGLTVTLRLDLLDPLLPGEAARVRATVLNRAQGAATGGRLELDVPEGWSVAPAELGTVEPGASRTVTVVVQVAGDAQPGEAVTLPATLSYREGTAEAAVEATVRPVVTLEAVHPLVPLAAGGYNRPLVRVVNGATRALVVDFAAAAPAGVTATLEAARLELAPGESRTVAVELRNADRATGTSELALTARTASGAESRAALTLRHSDNLAWNGVGAPWPAPSASGSQEAYPPALATDGLPATFWVSDGTQRGDGPSPERPKLLGVDFGAPVEVDTVRMVPRVNYGPRAYTIEVSADGESWQPVAAVPSAPNGTVTTSFAPTAARALRLRITDSHDAQRPPRNVQIAELEVR
jgi:hypothetical protein